MGLVFKYFGGKAFNFGHQRFLILFMHFQRQLKPLRVGILEYLVKLNPEVIQIFKLALPSYW